MGTLFLTVAALALSASAETIDDKGIRLVDADTLAALDDAQLTTLLEYTGACGRVALIGLSPDVESVFRNRAGCGGRYLAVTEAEIDRVQNLPPPPRATDTQLMTLLEAYAGAETRPTRFGYFITTYLTVLIILLRRRGTRLVAAIFSIVSTLAVYMHWPPASTRDFVAWAEASVDDHVAVYRSLERHRTFRDGRYSVEDTWGIGSFPVNPGMEAAIANAAATSCDGETMSNGAEQILFHERASAHETALLRPLPLAPNEGRAWLLQYAESGGEACGH